VSQRLGTRLNGYRLVSVLGVGGTATVYRGEQAGGEAVAVKVLHPWLCADPRAKKRLAREAAVASGLAHPAIVRIYAWGEAEDGTAYLVMELAEGETLEARRAASNGRLPPDEVLRLADELLSALAEAHARGVVHRDIKPGNLLVAPDGRLRVLDFGVARASESSDASSLVTRTGAVLGTASFMAPEQALGVRDDVDARSDVWAVGATIFTLLTGELVHRARTVNEALVLAATQPVPPIRTVLADMPAPIARVIDRALSFDRKERFPDASSMRAALARAKRGEADGPVVAIIETLPDPPTLTEGALPPEGAGASGGVVAHESPAPREPSPPPGRASPGESAVQATARRPRGWARLWPAAAGVALLAAGLLAGLFDASTGLRPGKGPPGLPAASPAPGAEATAPPGTPQADAAASQRKAGETEAPAGTPDADAPTEVLSLEWGPGWTNFMPFRLKGWPHQLSYNATTGRVHLDRFRPGGRGSDARWYSFWEPGWTHFSDFYVGGAPHFVAYHAATGAARFYRIRPELDGCERLGAASWPPALTHVVPFSMQGGAYFLLYNSATGQIRYEKVSAQGAGSKTAYRGSWDVGWTSFAPFARGDAPHLVVLQRDTGHVNYDRIPPGLDGMSVLGETAAAAPGASLFPLVTPKRFCFTVYRASGAARIDCVSDDGVGSRTVWAGQWLPNATLAVAFEQEGQPYQLLYDQATGATRSYRIPAW
jgi:eukaryotic-like serine/threonine-protein kinase